VFTSARLRSESTGTPLACTPSKSAPRSLSGLSDIFKATPAKAGAAPLRDEIKFRSPGPLFDLRVIAEGRLRPAATAPWPGAADRASPRAGVADVVVGWAVIRGTARPGLDGPATPREIPRRTDPTAIGSVWPGGSEVVLVVEPAQCDVAPYGW